MFFFLLFGGVSDTAWIGELSPMYVYQLSYLSMLLAFHILMDFLDDQIHNVKVAKCNDF